MDNAIGLKEQAIKLRKSGQSYNEINKVLGTPKSTLSSWFKDLPISEKVKKKNINRAKTVWAENIRSFNKIRSLNYKKQKDKQLKEYAQEIPILDKKALFWLGMGLFWAEGGKREQWSVRFVNSDTQINKIMMRFFIDICKADIDKFKFRIYLHPNISDESAKNYWSKTLGVSKKQFYQSQKLISKTSKGKRKFNQLSYGTLHIYIIDSRLATKMKGWLKGVSAQI